MMRYVSTPLVAAVFAGLFLSGGCVSQGKYDEALAQNNRMDKQRREALERANELAKANEELARALQEQKALMDALQQRYNMTDADRQKLLDKLKELDARIAELQKIKIEGLPPLPAALNEALKALADANPELMVFDPKLGMVKLKSDLTFDPGSDFLKPGAEEVLKKFAEIMNSPAAAKYNIYIAGHADDLRIGPETMIKHPDNWYLSVHRPIPVVHELAKDGVASQRIGAMGFGEYHPIVPNAANHKGNPLNRRVEIWIVPPDRFLTAYTAETPEK